MPLSRHSNGTDQVEEALTLVQQRTGRVFGDSSNPLLVSVRSGARASMPGELEQSNAVQSDTTEVEEIHVRRT